MRHRHSTTEARVIAAAALRAAADDAADWTTRHDTPPSADLLVERSADWARRTAATVEDDPIAYVGYEAQRTLRARPWLLPVTAVTLVALTVTVVGVVAARRRRAERARLLQAQEAAQAPQDGSGTRSAGTGAGSPNASR